MNDVKEQVWEGFRPKLRSRRIQRRAIASGAGLLAVAFAIGWMLDRGPVPQAPPVVKTAPPSMPEHLDPPPQLAVFVHDGNGLRLELVDAGAMSDSALALSLEPVVWSGETW